ncbi:MAG: helix-turn-helix domain-containing protein [Rhodospirillales bacterium]|nr:helix-turn-helix domain-containing protein [Rhodospirillales bacterium]
MKADIAALTPSARKLMSAMFGLAKGGRMVFASQKTMADKTGLHVRQIARTLQELRDAGMIARDGKQRVATGRHVDRYRIAESASMSAFMSGSESDNLRESRERTLKGSNHVNHVRGQGDPSALGGAAGPPVPESDNPWCRSGEDKPWWENPDGDGFPREYVLMVGLLAVAGHTLPMYLAEPWFESDELIAQFEAAFADPAAWVRMVCNHDAEEMQKIREDREAHYCGFCERRLKRKP